MADTDSSPQSLQSLRLNVIARLSARFPDTPFDMIAATFDRGCMFFAGAAAAERQMVALAEEYAAVSLTP